jgi:predicted unusual protein kinase regulating ubiquinone biosynthesis (AarF/ABC1/UbiB family)
MIFIHGDVHCDPHAANLVRQPGLRGGRRFAGWCGRAMHQGS